MNKVQEYVERVVKDGFDREVGQDENVVRSLPFFATSLGVLASAFGLSRPSLCAPASDPVSLGIYAALAGLGVSAGLTILFLLRTVLSRGYEYPMSERAFLAYANRASAAARAAAESDPELDVDDVVVDELRTLRIERLADATEVNRRQNVRRNRARGWALTMLIVAIGFAFLLLALIFGRDTFAPEFCHAGRHA